MIHARLVSSVALGLCLVCLSAPALNSEPPRPGPAADDEPLPAGARLRLGSTRWRQGGCVFSVAWAPDGKTVATAGGFSDRAIHLWDAATGKELRRFEGHTA